MAIDRMDMTDRVVASGGGGGPAAWGNITGVLTDQADLLAALNAKEPVIAAGTLSQYWRGDKTWQTLNKAAVGLANVDNTSDVNKPISTAAQTALDGKQVAGSYAAAAHGHAQADVTGLVAALAGKSDTGHTHPQSEVTNLVADLAAKQAALVSGTNIKTVNGNTLLGAGDLVISGGTVSPVTSRIYRNSNQSIAGGGVFADLVWSTPAYEVNGDFWTSGATVTIPETGYYSITSEATFDGTGLLTIATSNMQMLLNGATVIGEDEVMVAIGAKGSLFVLAQRLFTAGNTITVQVKHSDAGALNILAQGDHSPDIILTKLTGAKGDDGAPGAGGAVTQVVLNVAPVAVNIKEIVVADATVTALSKISAELVGELDAENDLEGLTDDEMRVWPVAETGQIRFVLTGKGAFSGPFKTNYRVAA